MIDRLFGTNSRPKGYWCTSNQLAQMRIKMFPSHFACTAVFSSQQNRHLKLVTKITYRSENFGNNINNSVGICESLEREIASRSTRWNKHFTSVTVERDIFNVRVEPAVCLTVHRLRAQSRSNETHRPLTCRPVLQYYIICLLIKK